MADSFIFHGNVENILAIKLQSWNRSFYVNVPRCIQIFKCDVI
jgi:hypothetical protein